ncbi:MAG: UvrD-helicase domain-containing protein [Polyangiaceae bacterium]
MRDPGLNRPQRDAVTTLSGPLLVLAGAGTGKTRVITYRIAELIKHRVKPDRILAVTFTNKAAKEMRERALALLGRRRRGATKPEISTFHSLCVRILRRHATQLGYPTHFSIYDRSDQETLARQALRDVRVGHEKLKPSEFIFIVSGWKSRNLPSDRAMDAAETDKEQLAALAYDKYQAALRASGAMDFDDLLLNVEQLFAEHPDVRIAEATRFDHLLIDEYQDTNGLQYRIVKALAERHRNLCVVGDDDQSIYGWRGAEVTHILSFQRDWPEAKVVRLEDNYRSRAPILSLANTLIAHNSERHDKTLRPSRQGGELPRFLRFEDETAEAEQVVREIAHRTGENNPERVSPSDVAILFRTNEQPRAFELELRRAGVPYVLVGGQSFYDRKEIRDIVAYLRVLANPADEVSLLRVINTPARGIGASTVAQLLTRAVAAGSSVWDILPDALESGELTTVVAERIEGFRRMLSHLRAQLGHVPLAAVAAEMLQTIDYRAEIERNYKNAGDVEARMNSIEELVNAIAQYEAHSDSPSLLGFLEECSLAGREDSKDDPEERQEHAVTLMTLHSAKGLEFPHVYMVGMEEGLLPHKRSVTDGGDTIAEERRLCYVGVTRARETLTLSLCKNRMKWGKLRPQIPSRFLLEMRGDTAKAEEVAEEARLLLAAEARAIEQSRGKKERRSGSRAPRQAARAAKAPAGPRASGEASLRPAAPPPVIVPSPTLAERPQPRPHLDAPLPTPDRPSPPKVAERPPPAAPTATPARPQNARTEERKVSDPGAPAAESAWTPDSALAEVEALLGLNNK